MSNELTITIRPMLDTDCGRVSEVLRAAFAWLGQREGFNERQLAYLLGERSSEETVRRESASRPHFVACIDGQVVAMAVVHGQELARLYVHPDFHRHGIGRRLFETVEDAIRDGGFDTMRVGALVESAATFYKAMGMKVSGAVDWEPEIFGERQVTILTKRL